MEPQPQDACLGLQVAHEGLGIWIRRVDEQSHNGRRWDQLVQQLRSLEPQFPAQRDHAREIAACKAALKKSRRSGTKVRQNKSQKQQCHRVPSFHDTLPLAPPNTSVRGREIMLRSL